MLISLRSLPKTGMIILIWMLIPVVRPMTLMAVSYTHLDVYKRQGYGCVNCRKMEAAVWTDPKVSDLINNDYVLITLYVDNKTPLTEPVKIVENGKERTLRTVGDKWSYLQRVKFGANAQPFYVLLDNQGSPLNKSYAYDEDIPKYIEFLQTGLENYRKEK